MTDVPESKKVPPEEDGPEATEYRRLKGEVEALGEAANRKKCGFS